jgi:hypothetical protein
VRHASFHLSIDERGSCHGFSAEGAQLLAARAPSDCIVAIRMPLPPGSDAATVVGEGAEPGPAQESATATAWLALDDGGACVAFASTSSGLEDVREAADRYAGSTGLEIAVVRVDVPLPAGSASARVTLT